MRLITRTDTSLAVGLVVGTIVVFQQPLRFVLDVARDVEVRYHVDLVSALTIISGVFIFHQYRKRQLSIVEATASAAEAARSQKRSEELERLIVLSQALANALDIQTVQQILARSLPVFARERPFWVVARVAGRWQEVFQDTTRRSKLSLEILETLATLAVAEGTLTAARSEGLAHGQGLYFPMHAMGAAVGVLGVDAAVEFPHADRHALAAAAALISIALRNVQLFKETREHSLRDPLTGCFNREYCLDTLDAELRRAKRSGRPLSIAIFDIDNFKTINDELGHLRGDDALRAVGAQLARLLRSTDVSCRYGGDEFIVILPETNLAGAVHVGENLRKEIATLSIAAADGRVIAVTISVGVAAASPSELDVTALVTRADDALYLAKGSGRNRVCAAGPAGVTQRFEPVPNIPTAATRAAPGAMGRETVMVVDDERFVRELIRRSLEVQGYTILEAANADDALTIAQTYGGPIHLLLTDIVMPDQHGPQLADRIRGHRPEIAVVYMSGFSGHLAAVDRSAAFLQKPFTSQGLEAVVRKQLEQERRHRPVA
ncbi:MAG: diguanylate cyclase [Acidobacteriota bacterium]